MPTYLRYLLRQLAGPALIGVLALSGAVWLSQSLRFVDLIVNKGLPVTTFLYLTLLLFPSLLMVILPFALFAAVLFVYHRLTLDSELVVMKATGLSNWQLALPCLLLAGLVTFIGYAISLYFMPLAYRSFKDLQYEIRRDFSHLLLQVGVFNSPVRGITVYVREQAEDGSMRGILVHDDRRRQTPVTIMAERGLLVQGEAGPLFVLEQGNRQELEVRGGDGSALSILHFDRYTLDLAAASPEPGGRVADSKERYLHELLNPEESDPARRRELIAEGHQRLTWPLNTMVFALIGLAALLSHRFDRRGPWRRSLLAVIVALAVQALSLGAGNLATQSLAAIPVLYAVSIIPALAALAVIAGVVPRGRPQPEAVAAP